METFASRIARDGALNTTDAVGWIVRLARTLERTHARGSVHGRVSPHCILIASDECASTGRIVEPDQAPDPVAYYSPERVEGEAPTPSDDTWALAVTLFELITGTSPFQGEDDEETRAQILAAKPPPLVVFDVKDDMLQDILTRALAREWMDRSNSLAALRRELEGWKPGARFAALPPLDDPRIPTSIVPPRLMDPSIRHNDDDDAPTLVTQPKDTADILKSVLETPKPPPPAAKPAAPAAKPAPPAAKPAAPATPVPKGDDASEKFDFKGLRSRLLSGESVGDSSAAPPASTPDPGSNPRIPGPPALPDLPAPTASAAADEEAPTSSAPAEAKPAPKAKPAPPPPRAAAADASAAPAPSSVSAPIAVPQAAPAKSGGSTKLVIIGGVVALAAAGAFLAFRPKPAPPRAATPPPVTAAAPAATLAAAAPAATQAATATTAAPVETAAAMTTAAAETAAPASAAAPGDLAACVKPLFASDTFNTGPMPDFSFVCQETDPRKGGATTRSRVVSSNTGHVSDGMREWALSGWYEMASFAVIRARCCPSAPPLKLPDTGGKCTPLDQRLNELGEAAMAAKDRKDAKLKEAVENYTGGIHCLVRHGTTGPFVRHDNPQGGEDTAFLKTLGRVVASNQK